MNLFELDAANRKSKRLAIQILSVQNKAGLTYLRELLMGDNSAAFWTFKKALWHLYREQRDAITELDQAEWFAARKEEQDEAELSYKNEDLNFKEIKVGCIEIAAEAPKKFSSNERHATVEYYVEQLKYRMSEKGLSREEACKAGGGLALQDYKFEAEQSTSGVSAYAQDAYIKRLTAYGDLKKELLASQTVREVKKCASKAYSLGKTIPYKQRQKFWKFYGLMVKKTSRWENVDLANRATEELAMLQQQQQEDAYTLQCA